AGFQDEGVELGADGGEGVSQGGVLTIAGGEAEWLGREDLFEARDAGLEVTGAFGESVEPFAEGGVADRVEARLDGEFDLTGGFADLGEGGAPLLVVQEGGERALLEGVGERREFAPGDVETAREAVQDGCTELEERIDDGGVRAERIDGSGDREGVVQEGADADGRIGEERVARGERGGGGGAGEDLDDRPSREPGAHDADLAVFAYEGVVLDGDLEVHRVSRAAPPLGWEELHVGDSPDGKPCEPDGRPFVDAADLVEDTDHGVGVLEAHADPVEEEDDGGAGEEERDDGEPGHDASALPALASPLRHGKLPPHHLMTGSDACFALDIFSTVTVSPCT